MRSPPKSQRVLALLSEVRADGGIQRFNRTLLAACEELGVVCDVLSLNDAGALPGGAGEGSERPRPQRLTGFDGSRLRFSLAAAARLAGGRYDWLLVGHIHFLAFALTARALCVHRRPQVVLVAHGIEVWTMIGWVRRRALACVAKILCVSTYTRRRILEQAPSLDAARLQVFPNAIDDQWSRLIAAPSGRVLPDRFLLSVSRLEKGDRYKGIVTVLEALPMVQDDALQYLVVGRGGDIEFLKLAAR
ncbi:MAG TPA: glycosyltransferase, partial [Stellaceae bacterium]|nr:glycosyltransferase [Stellaceae bacterium]